MGEQGEPAELGAAGQISNKRLLWILAALGVAGALAGALWISAKFGLGVLAGSGLAFANYFWLRHTLRRVFDRAETGDRPRFLGSGYFLRYFALAAILLVIFATDVLPMAAVILGLAGFGFAIVIEGSIRIFGSVFNS